MMRDTTNENGVIYNMKMKTMERVREPAMMRTKGQRPKLKVHTWELEFKIWK